MPRESDRDGHDDPDSRSENVETLLTEFAQTCRELGAAIQSLLNEVASSR